MTTPDFFLHGIRPRAFLLPQAFSLPQFFLLPQAFYIRVFFGLVIAAAAWTDVRCRRIPNHLLLYAAFPGGLILGPVFPARMILCTLLLYPLFRLRLTGAGDVKLLAVAAAWAGPDLFFRFCFFSLLAAFVPSALLLLKGRYGAKLPMGPFFLAGWAAANCLAFPVLPL